LLGGPLLSQFPSAPKPLTPSSSSPPPSPSESPALCFELTLFFLFRFACAFAFDPVSSNLLLLDPVGDASSAALFFLHDTWFASQFFFPSFVIQVWQPRGQVVFFKFFIALCPWFSGLLVFFAFVGLSLSETFFWALVLRSRNRRRFGRARCCPKPSPSVPGKFPILHAQVPLTHFFSISLSFFFSFLLCSSPSVFVRMVPFFPSYSGRLGLPGASPSPFGPGLAGFRGRHPPGSFSPCDVVPFMLQPRG